MNDDALHDCYDVAVIGGGQAGLATGYYLAQRGLDFVILDAADLVGDPWRSRWDSLRLFTSGRYNGLPGMTFPGPRLAYPSKDDVADYLVAYAARFGLPVRSGTRVDRVSRLDDGDGFVVSANGQQIRADNVVLASGAYQDPFVPEFAADLDPSIVQLHSSQYRRPSQLRDGPVLIVGAGNSGAEIALDVVGEHRTILAGRDPGQIPVDLDGRLGAVLDPLIWFALATSCRSTTRSAAGAAPRAFTACRSSAPGRRGCARPASSAARRGRSACGKASRSSTTARWSMQRTSSGARASGATTRGSTCRSSVTMAGPWRITVLSRACRASISWGCRSRGR